MSEELPPLPDDVLALLAVEKPLVIVDAASRARALARVEASLASLGGAAGSAAASNALVTMAKGKLAVIVGAAFVGGALTGGAVMNVTRGEPGSSAAPVVQATVAPAPTIETTAPPPAPAASVPTIPVQELATASTSTSTSTTTTTTAGASAELRAQGLAAERALLDIARGALARGTPEAALDATKRHAKDYPQGVLAEEREALAIRALIALGQKSEAAARAERFRARHPRSLMLPAIEAALEGRAP